MKILTFPHSMLSTPCEEVDSFDPHMLEVLELMWSTMKKNGGMGLAANQIGVSMDMFVMEGPSGRVDFINPYIYMASEEAANLEEGCLSAPGQLLVVPGRAKWVQVVYQNIEGEHKTMILRGIHAVCAQHEIDHLDGKSFLEHPSLSRITRKKLEKKWGTKK